MIFLTVKNGYTRIFFHSFGAVVGSGMDKNQDPGSGINIPDPQHWKLHKSTVPSLPGKVCLVLDLTCSQRLVVVVLLLPPTFSTIPLMWIPYWRTPRMGVAARSISNRGRSVLPPPPTV
jgi:hypothetical protein